MPDLQFGSRSCISWISIAYLVALINYSLSVKYRLKGRRSYPLLGSLRKTSLGALRVPHARSSEAPVRDSGKGSTSSEDREGESTGEEKGAKRG